MKKARIGVIGVAGRGDIANYWNGKYVNILKPHSIVTKTSKYLNPDDSVIRDKHASVMPVPGHGVMFEDGINPEPWGETDRCRLYSSRGFNILG